MLHWFLTLDIIEGPVTIIVWALTLAALIVLLVRAPRRRWLRRASIAVILGAAIGVGAVMLLDLTEAFGVPLPDESMFWAGACLAGLGLAVVSLWNAKPWRRIIAVISILLVLVSTTLGVNAMFGINRTVGDLLGISTLKQADGLPAPTPDDNPEGPLYASWKAPADMPQKGEVRQLSGALQIPSTAGFVPRDASIYLPPAALVKNPPKLPVVVQMMGKPGDPNPQFVQEALDAMAAKNNGLAPIVITADQLGDPGVNPACTDSKKFGGVETYFNKDIPEFITSHLNVLHDPEYWAISGYSNGGACSFMWGAAHPDRWGSLVSISGEEYAGTEEPDTVLKDVFQGDQAAYDASKPQALLTKNGGHFSGHLAIFTAGENDPAYVAAAQRSADLARSAGFDTTQYVVPGADHVVTALQGGLPKAFEVLYPHWGLAAPPA